MIVSYDGRHTHAAASANIWRACRPYEAHPMMILRFLTVSLLSFITIAIPGIAASVRRHRITGTRREYGRQARRRVPVSTPIRASSKSISQRARPRSWSPARASARGRTTAASPGPLIRRVGDRPDRSLQERVLSQPPCLARRSLPIEMDGVPDISQPEVKRGYLFDYLRLQGCRVVSGITRTWSAGASSLTVSARRSSILRGHR